MTIKFRKNIREKIIKEFEERIDILRACIQVLEFDKLKEEIKGEMKEKTI